MLISGRSAQEPCVNGECSCRCCKLIFPQNRTSPSWVTRPQKLMSTRSSIPRKNAICNWRRQGKRSLDVTSNWQGWRVINQNSHRLVACRKPRQTSRSIPQISPKHFHTSKKFNLLKESEFTQPYQHLTAKCVKILNFANQQNKKTHTQTSNRQFYTIAAISQGVSSSCALCVCFRVGTCVCVCMCVTHLWRLHKSVVAWEKIGNTTAGRRSNTQAYQDKTR